MTLTRFKLLSRRRVLAGSLAAGVSLILPYTAQAKTDETALVPNGEAIFYFPHTGHHISGAYALSCRVVELLRLKFWNRASEVR